MNYLDIAIIALIVLCALVGLCKGFFKSLIGMFGWLVALLIAFFCAKPLAEWIVGSWGAKFVLGDTGSLYSFFFGKLPEAVRTLEIGASADQISAALGTGVFGSLLKPFIGLLTGSAFAETSATVGEGIALVLANATFTLICGIAIFILVRIVMAMFGRFANSAIDSSRTLSAANRFLGFALGAARGALYACILLLIASFMTGLPFMSGYNKLLNDQSSVIAKPMSEFVVKLPEKILNDDDWFSKLLEDAGLVKKEETPGEGNLPVAPDEGTDPTENPGENPDTQPGTDKQTPTVGKIGRLAFV